MLRNLLIILFITICGFCSNGQEKSFLRPLVYEATDIGNHYRNHYDNLTNELSRYPLARTFHHSTYSYLTSIEKTNDDKYILYCRGYEGRYKLNSYGDTIGYKRPKKIIKTQVAIDSTLALTLQKLFNKVIAETRYHDREIIMTHEYHCYFYTWNAGQGDIAGKAQYYIVNPLYESLIGIHESLVKYATIEVSRVKEKEYILSTSGEILKKYN